MVSIFTLNWLLKGKCSSIKTLLRKGAKKKKKKNLLLERFKFKIRTEIMLNIYNVEEKT